MRNAVHLNSHKDVVLCSRILTNSILQGSLARLVSMGTQVRSGQPESREVTKEGGDRKEPEQEEPWPPTPGGWPTVVEQVLEEPGVETERERARGSRASEFSELPSGIRAHSWLDLGTESLSLLDWETGAHSGLDGTSGVEGEGASGLPSLFSSLKGPLRSPANPDAWSAHPQPWCSEQSRDAAINRFYY